MRASRLSFRQYFHAPAIAAGFAAVHPARWLAGNDSSKDLLPKHLPAIVRGRPPRFPLAFLRRHYVRAGLSFYRLRDIFDR